MSLVMKLLMLLLVALGMIPEALSLKIEAIFFFDIFLSVARM